jgi:hypothetical protein
MTGWTHSALLDQVYAPVPTGGLILTVFGECSDREDAHFLAVVSFSNVASTVEPPSGLTSLSL